VEQPLWVSWVSGHSKNSSWGCPTLPKKLKGFISNLLASKGMQKSAVSRQLLNAIEDA